MNADQVVVDASVRHGELSQRRARRMAASTPRTPEVRDARLLDVYGNHRATPRRVMPHTTRWLARLLPHANQKLYG